MKRRTILQHLQTWGRHDAHRGATEGVEMDDSDIEWEEHVRTHYGGRGYNRGVDNSVPMDMDLDIDGLVRDVVQNYEDVREAAWANSQTCQNVGEEVSDVQRDAEDAATMDKNENVQDMPGEDEQHQQPQVQLDFDALNDAYWTPLYSGARLSCLAAVPLQNEPLSHAWLFRVDDE